MVFLVCDSNSNSGEGRLARIYMEREKEKNLGEREIRVFSNDTRNTFLSFLTETTAFPAYLWLWRELLRFRKCKSVELHVVNYLPIWNFVTFLIVPKTAKLAPVTGSGSINWRHFHGNVYQVVCQVFVRNYILKFFAKISSYVIKKRKLKVLAATPFVSEILKCKNKKHLYISTVFDPSEIRSSEYLSKKFDIIAYTNDHPLKNNRILASLVEELVLRGIKIAIVANGKCKSKFSYNGVTLFENLDHVQMMKLIRQSKSALVCSLEGAGFFAQEAAMRELQVFCFSGTGASLIPGSLVMCGSNESPKTEKIASKIVEELSKVSQTFDKEELCEFVDGAKKYFFSSD